MSNPSTPQKSEHFVIAADQLTEDMGGGLLRTILAYEPSLMLVRAEFEEGSIGYVHDHPHAQMAYVESGAFDFTIGDETRGLSAGDCAYVPSGVAHGAVCIEKGVLLALFRPAREDFLEGK